MGEEGCEGEVEIDLPFGVCLENVIVSVLYLIVGKKRYGFTDNDRNFVSQTGIDIIG